MASNCPTPERLLAYLVEGRRSASAGRLERHLRDCKSCRVEAESLRGSVAALRTYAAQAVEETSACLDEASLATLIDGDLNRERRAPMVAHVAGCARCRREVAAISRALADPSIAAEISRPDSEKRRVRQIHVARIAGVAGLAAAAVGILLISRPFGSRDEVASDTHREPVMTTAAPPVTVSPEGSVREVSALQWTSVPRADRYEVTLFDREGSVLWEATAQDTFAMLPHTVTLNRGSRYFWKVRARVGWDRWVESELTEFSVSEPQRDQ